MLYSSQVHNGNLITDVYFKTLSLDTLDQVLAIEANTAHDYSKFYRLISDEVVKTCIKSQMSMGIFNKNDQLIGQLLAKPPLEDDIISLLPTNIDSSKMVFLYGVSINKQYAHNALCEQLCLAILDILENQFDIDYVVSTIHPDNAPSLIPHFRVGFRIISFQHCFANKPRYVIFKDLNKQSLFPKKSQLLASYDIDKIRKILKSGWQGYLMIGNNENDYIYFGDFNTKC